MSAATDATRLRTAPASPPTRVASPRAPRSSSGSPRPTTRSSATSTSSPRSSGSCSPASWRWSSAPSSPAPGLQIVDTPDQYNQMFTMHGTIMLLLFATPLFAGFANALMPLQIGAPDVAFPRLNMLAYWAYFFGGLIAGAGFLTPGGAAAFGWFAYAPLSDNTYSPGLGGDLWVFGLALGGFGTILGAVNFITTILTMRAPGMTMFRMPIFTWTVLVTSILVLLIFPALAAALFALGADRRFGAHVFDPVQRRADAVATHLLVLRAPRGLRHRPALLRHHLRGAAGLLAQADLRLQDPRLRHHRHRGPVGQRLGAPHVRHRAGAAAVLRDHDDADRGADRGEVLQLGRHDVGRKAVLRHSHAVGPRLPGHLPVRRPDRCHPRQPGARLPALRQLLRGRPLPLRRLRHGRLRDVRRVLLLVAEVHRADARRAARQDPLLAAVHRLPHDLPRAAPARHPGHAPALRRLPARGRLHPRQPHLHRSARSSSPSR